MVVLGTILCFIYSVLKRQKSWILKRFQCFNKHAGTNYPPGNSSVQWDGIILHVFYQKLCLNYVTNHQVVQKKLNFLNGQKSAIILGRRLKTNMYKPLF
jgi:hypothetical protein